MLSLRTAPSLRSCILLLSDKPWVKRFIITQPVSDLLPPGSAGRPGDGPSRDFLGRPRQYRHPELRLDSSAVQLRGQSTGGKLHRYPAGRLQQRHTQVAQPHVPAFVCVGLAR